ncbi:MAG TPA: Zn-dependent hydrolase, partial [Nostoc sp.]|nr:Zn-dependent hydrolase [Nostoc sp.]
CDISPLDNFLTVMQGMTVRRSNGDSISISPKDLPENSVIQVLSYKF